MAIKLDAGEVTRSEAHNIFPEHIIADHSKNTRITRRTPEQVEAFARKILADGQQTPCLFRRIAGNKVELVEGYGRHEAITYLNANLNPPQPFRVQGKFGDVNDEEAFVKSIKSNLDRLDPNAMDAAHAQRELREKFNWTEDRIAELYEKSIAWVSQNRKLLQLATPLQEMVRKKEELPVATAILVTQLPEAEQQQAVTEATKPNGTVDAAPIKKKVRAKAQENGQKSPGLSLKEFKEFLAGNVGPADWNDQSAVKDLCGKLLDFIEGKREMTEKKMNNAFEKFCKTNKQMA